VSVGWIGYGIYHGGRAAIVMDRYAGADWRLGELRQQIPVDERVV